MAPVDTDRKDTVEPSTDSGEPGKKKDKRDNVRFWQRWIAAAKQASKRHMNDSRRAWREYDGDTERFREDGRQFDSGQSGSGGGERYPIYWASIKTIESAFYSRTPETYARRMFDIDDENALTMALIIDRLGKYLIETGEFDTAMRGSVADYINADKAAPMICYDYAEEKQPTRRSVVPLQDDPTRYIDAETGEEILDEIYQDEQGYFTELLTDEIAEQRIYSKPMPYDHILHTPTAKTPYEIQDMAYYFCLTRAEANERFGEAKVKEWPDTVWKTTRSYERERREVDRNVDEQSPDKIIEGWECWSKVTKKVYWYCPDLSYEFLDEKEDPYHLKGFFPSPRFAIGTKPSKSLYPTPAFIRLWPTLDMLHVMYGRVFNLIDAVRRRALVDGGSDELVAALENAGESEFIAVQNMRALVEKGGLETMVWYVPVQELVQAIGELNAQDDKFKNNIYEWFGVPDILRGASDPVETAAAQEAKVSAAHDRFKDQKKMIQELARETLEIMIDMALYLYDDQKIAKIVGFDYMPVADQQRFPAALGSLRNDTERTIRIEIETDSTSFMGEQVRLQQRNAVVSTVVEGFAKIGPMLEQSPAMATIAAKIMSYSLAGIPGGRSFADEVKGAIDELIEQMENPPEPPPPPPDYAAMKAQTDQFKAETDRMKADSAAMKTQAELMGEQMAQMRADFELQLKQQKQEFEQYVQDGYLQLDGARLGIEAQNKGVDNERLGLEAQAKVIAALKPEPEAPAAESKEGSTTVIINAPQPSPVPEIIL